MIEKMFFTAGNVRMIPCNGGGRLGMGIVGKAGGGWYSRGKSKLDIYVLLFSQRDNNHIFVCYMIQ